MNYVWNYIALEGITYNTLPKHQIETFMSEWIAKEWRIDHSLFPDQPWTIEWLNLLPKMQFQLEKVELDNIRPRKDLMNYHSETDNFMESLRERAIEREESVLRGVSIEPVIINSENFELMDGYTRYTVLQNLGKRTAYAYLGTTT
jgi:hypothetical protein